LGDFIGIDNMDELRTSFVVPIWELGIYVFGNFDANDNFGFTNDDGEMISLIKNIRFLKHFMENIESVVEGRLRKFKND